MNYDDKTITIIEIVGQAMGLKIETATIPASTFTEAGLSYSEINKGLEQLAESKIIIVLKAPKSASDKSDYVVKPTKSHKEFQSNLETDLMRMRDLQILKTYYTKVRDIFDAMLGQIYYHEDPQMNHYYTYLTKYIDEIIAKDTFANHREEMPKLPESLLNSLEELDMGWEFLRPEMQHFIANLERQWILTNIEPFELTEDEQQLLKLTDEAIAEYRQVLSKNQPSNGSFNADNDIPDGSDLRSILSDTSDKPPTKSTGEQTRKDPINMHQLKPNHYAERIGLLWLSANDSVPIAAKGKVRRPKKDKKRGEKYDECLIMEHLFKNVKMLGDGVKISNVYTINASKVDAKMVKKVRRHVFEINRKVYLEGGPKRLIFVQAKAVHIDKSYL